MKTIGLPILLTIFCFFVVIFYSNAEECYINENDLGSNKLLCFDIIEKMPSNYTLSNITQILIFKAEMTAIAENFFDPFDKHQIQTLTLSRGNLSSVNESSFNTLTELNYLNLSFNKISNVSEKSFQKNYKLKTISLMSNEITKLQKNTFNTLYDLESIDLARNNLKHLDKHLFLNNTNLTFIDVKFNGLTEISGVMFHHLPMLKNLDLSFNQLETIPPHVFKRNYALKQLNLQGNKIKTLDYAICHLGLEDLNLLGNPLDTHNEKNLEVLEHLKRSNMILKIPDHFDHKHKKHKQDSPDVVFTASPVLQFVLGGIMVLLVIILIVLGAILYHIYVRKHEKVYKRYYPERSRSEERLGEGEESDIHLSDNTFFPNGIEEYQMEEHKETCSCFTRDNRSIDT